MPRSAASGVAAPFSFRQRLKEIDLFFRGEDEVHKTMRRLVRRLQKAGIHYAIVGGMAVNAHQHERTTKDVDVLLTQKGFAQFLDLFVPKNYRPISGGPRRFADKVNGKSVDFLLTGLFPGSGKPGPIIYPDPAKVSEEIHKYQVVNLLTLLTLKLAARRHQDFADVVSLIDIHHLDESFREQLHPSLRRDYIECLEEKRREDEYKARQ
jgi:hypothetical protein